MTSTDAWSLARDRFLTETTLTLEEKAVLQTCTAERVLIDIQALDAQHAKTSRGRQIIAGLTPLFAGLERIGKAMYVYSNVVPFGALSLV